MVMAIHCTTIDNTLFYAISKPYHKLCESYEQKKMHIDIDRQVSVDFPKPMILRLKMLHQ